MTSHRTLAAVAAVAALQSAVLAWMVAERIIHLTTGREITLAVEPVDPRALFRGDYVRLSYAITRPPPELIQGAPPAAGDPAYVTLARAADGSWQPLAVTAARPAVTGDDRIVLKAYPPQSFARSEGWSKAWGKPDSRLTLRYGIESYFVPEGSGRDLERMAADRQLAVRLSVAGDGTAAIKGLVVDGVDRYEEPLF